MEYHASQPNNSPYSPPPIYNQDKDPFIHLNCFLHSQLEKACYKIKQNKWGKVTIKDCLRS